MVSFYNSIAGQKIQRIESISDGVFAIALTLMVFDIKVPTMGISTERELMASLINLTPKFLSYFLSFMTLGLYWTGHSAQFIFIEKSDRNLSWISLFFLLFISILPFTTSFLGQHMSFKLAVGLYWLNIFVLGLLLYFHWMYAERHGFTSTAHDQSKMVSLAIRTRIIVGQALYTGGALLCFINTYLSIVVIILVQLNFAFAILSRNSKLKKANDMVGE